MQLNKSNICTSLTGRSTRTPTAPWLRHLEGGCGYPPAFSLWRPLTWSLRRLAHCCTPRQARGRWADASPDFKPFWPPAQSQQALAAIILMSVLAGRAPTRRQTRALQCDIPALLPCAAMPCLSPFRYPAAVRGGLCAGKGAVVREIWPYKPVAHSSARR